MKSLIKINKPLYINRCQKYKPSVFPFDHQQLTLPQLRSVCHIHKDMKQNVYSNQKHIQAQKHSINVVKQQLKKLLEQCRQDQNLWLLNRKKMIKEAKQKHCLQIEKVMKNLQKIRNKIYLQFRHICNKQASNVCSHCVHRSQAYQRKAIKAIDEAKLSFEIQNISKLTFLKAKHKTQTILPQKRQKKQQNQINLKHKIAYKSSQVDKLVQKKHLFGKKTNRTQTVTLKDSQSSCKKITQSSQETAKIQSKNSLKSSKKEELSSKFCQQSSRTLTANDSFVEIEYDSDAEEKKSQYSSEDSSKNHSMKRGDKSKSTASVIKIFNKNNQSKRCDTQISLSRSQAKSNTEQNKSESKARENSIQKSNFIRKTHKKGTAFKKAKVNKRSSQIQKQQQKISQEINQAPIETTVKQNINKIIKGQNKKSQKSRKAKILKKLNTHQLDELEMLQTSQEEDKLININKNITEDEQVDEDQKIRQFLRNNHRFLKFTRYQRQRVFYELLENELTKAEAAQDVVDQQKQQPIKRLVTTTSSRFSRQPIKTNIPQKLQQPVYPELYKVSERKESLITKLCLYSQAHNLQSLRAKVEKILHEPQIAEQIIKNREQTQTKLTRRIVQSFLAQLLEITDLKRLMKQKFVSEEDWNKKMRELHQFYIYLEYTLQLFRMRLAQIQKDAWAKLASQGNTIQDVVEGLLMNQQIVKWKAVETHGCEEEFGLQRQIECSMKYYGINVGRDQLIDKVFKYDQPYFVQPNDTILAQRSMKEIRLIDQPK